MTLADRNVESGQQSGLDRNEPRCEGSSFSSLPSATAHAAVTFPVRVVKQERTGCPIRANRPLLCHAAFCEATIVFVSA